MLDRRAFVQGAALLAALPLAAAGAPGVHKVIFDADVPQSRLFGAAASGLGADVLAIRGDVTDLWHDGLFQRGENAFAAIAGMTRFHSFFTVEMLAADAGLRVIYRGHHHIVSNGTTSHDLYGPKRSMRHINLDGSDADWSRSVAEALTSWPTDQMIIVKAHSTITGARAQEIGGGTLVSWLIAHPVHS